jgi:hypothetical protein
VLFALPLEELTDRAAYALLDHVVGVQERKGKAPGEVSPDGGFA